MFLTRVFRKYKIALEKNPDMPSFHGIFHIVDFKKQVLNYSKLKSSIFYTCFNIGRVDFQLAQ